MRRNIGILFVLIVLNSFTGLSVWAKSTPKATTSCPSFETEKQDYERGKRLELEGRYADAFKAYLRSAQEGYAKSQYKVGFCFNFGHGVKMNKSEAALWYRKAAEQGHAEAQFCLGGLCYFGLGVEKNPTEAIRWYRKAAKQGHANAQSSLGDCYCLGLFGIEKNPVKAFKWYSKAAEQGDAEAQLSLARCYDRGSGVEKNSEVANRWYNKAFQWYRKAAEQGDAAAQFSLACCYRDGEGVKKNLPEAIKWYIKSANQGNIVAQLFLDSQKPESESEQLNWYLNFAKQGYLQAQYDLAVCYVQGKGVKQNIAEAVRWYYKAAEQGHTDAQCELAICYKFGIVVEKDLTKAAHWYRKAAEQGHTDSQYFLAVCYLKGKGVEKNITEAVRWYRKAAEQGYAWAQYDLGICYSVGEGIEKNLVKSAHWYRKAAEQGHADAQYCLAGCYANGEGVEKNMVKAAHWHSKAAEQGHANAQFCLGTCYDFGEGVEKNMAEAIRWYRKAAEQEHAEAQYNLAICYYKGEGVIEDWREAYKWLLLAGSEGKDVSKAKEIISKKLTRQEILESQQRAKDFLAALKNKNEEGNTAPQVKVAEKKPESLLATGTGFLVSQKGLILTAWHVVDGAQNIEVWHGGKAYRAKYITGDKSTDVAVLRVDEHFPTALSLVSSSSADVSEKVFTVGFPNVGIQGAEPKYTDGVISAKSGLGGLMKYFQISVPIQPGNSGGPLVNRKGQVVGMVTLKLNELAALEKTGSLPQNVNYALKSSFILPYLEPFADEIKQSRTQNASGDNQKEIVNQTISSVVFIATY